MLDAVRSKFDRFLELAQEHAQSRPWLVVILMHEYFRHLYPADPHIPFNHRESPPARITRVLDTCIALLQGAASIGSYFPHTGGVFESRPAEPASRVDSRTDEGQTQQVYGPQWDKFDPDTLTRDATDILEQRLRHSDFKLSSLKGQTVLDQGCGSGRYTLALAAAGAVRAVGIDLGSESLERARHIAHKAGLANIEFRQGDVLKLPYADGTFDFVFCNGVLHHTQNIEQGIREMYRVLNADGRAYLYLYADGGLFWYSRRRMPTVMQRIPQAYTMAVLDLIGMPADRFLFTDNWYVPIERHTTRTYLMDLLRSVGFTSVQKIRSGRTTDLDSIAVASMPDAELLWGEGEHRYLLAKG